MEKTLNKIYYDIKNPASFGSINKLYNEACKINNNIKKSDVINYLKKQETFTLHKYSRKKFITNKIFSDSVDANWQIDLTDMQKYASFNDGYRYIFFIIDVYSRYLFLTVLKTKNSQEVIDSFVNVIHQYGRAPGFIACDKGSEFINKKFNNMLREFNIGIFHLYSAHKASLVERVQRTIKEKLFKYFTKFNTYRYIDILHHVQESYNNTIHRIINTTPHKKSLETKLIKKYGMLKIKAKYKIGEYVRVSRVKNIMGKGYTQNWSREIFRINKILYHKSHVPMYILKDHNDVILEGPFYDYELQAVDFNPSAEFQIEKIIHETGKGRNKKYLVKWLGWPKQFNSYIKASTIKNI